MSLGMMKILVNGSVLHQFYRFGIVFVQVQGPPALELSGCDIAEPRHLFNGHLDVLVVTEVVAIKRALGVNEPPDEIFDCRAPPSDCIRSCAEIDDREPRAVRMRAGLVGKVALRQLGEQPWRSGPGW